MSSFREKDTALLTPGAFAVVLDSELKRAARAQNYVTLVTLETSREWQGMAVPVDRGVVQEVAQIISHEIRDTDVIGHTDEGVLALVLLDSDFEHSTSVVDRLLSMMADHEFPAALRITVGAACCPTNAVDAASLKREAMLHPIMNWRGKSTGGATFSNN
jgi:hypothetical protein